MRLSSTNVMVRQELRACLPGEREGGRAGGLSRGRCQRRILIAGDRLRNRRSDHSLLLLADTPSHGVPSRSGKI